MKCPSCQKSISYVRFRGIESRQAMGRNVLNAIAHLCPSCLSVLSVQVDPVALKTDIVRAVVRELKGTQW